MQSSETSSKPSRRGFFKEAATILVGGVLGLVPVLAGLAVFLDPLRRKVEKSGAILITTLDSLPGDGVPRKFPVLANRTDAWNKFVQVPIGAVYLRRTSANTLQALNVVCPHLGCSVEFETERLDQQRLLSRSKALASTRPFSTKYVSSTGQIVGT